MRAEHFAQNAVRISRPIYHEWTGTQIKLNAHRINEFPRKPNSKLRAFLAIIFVLVQMQNASALQRNGKCHQLCSLLRFSLQVFVSVDSFSGFFVFIFIFLRKQLALILDRDVGVCELISNILLHRLNFWFGRFDAITSCTKANRCDMAVAVMMVMVWWRC